MTFQEFRKFVAGVIFTEPRFWEDDLLEVAEDLDDLEKDTERVKKFKAAFDAFSFTTCVPLDTIVTTVMIAITHPDQDERLCQRLGQRVAEKARMIANG